MKLMAANHTCRDKSALVQLCLILGTIGTLPYERYKNCFFELWHCAKDRGSVLHWTIHLGKSQLRSFVADFYPLTQTPLQVFTRKNSSCFLLHGDGPERGQKGASIPRLQGIEACGPRKA